MIELKTAEEIEILREGGKRLAYILHELQKLVRPGLDAKELNDLALALVKEGGDRAAFLNYKPYGAKRAFPAALCVSVNDEVVHGIPHEAEKILKEGDIVSLDMGLIHKGLITDSAVTVPVGTVDEKARKLLSITKDALMIGIKAAKPEGTVGDIGAAIQKFVEPHEFGIVRELAGHGVGYAVHEDPYVPNYGVKGRGERLKPGLVIAIEPMLNEGSRDIVLDKDGYTYKTKDGKRSAHFEHTIVITERGSEILTKM